MNELSMDRQVMPELAAATVSGMTEAESEQSHSAYLIVLLSAGFGCGRVNFLDSS